MTLQEFEKQMSRLISEYDSGIEKKYYGPQRTNAIFKTFRWMEAKEFAEIIDAVFVSEKFAPMAKDLLRIKEELRVSFHNKSKEQKKPWDGLKDPDPIHVKEQIGNIFDILKNKR